MNPPISVILLVSFLKHWSKSFVRIKYLSFHREKSLSRCCHSNPFLMLVLSCSKTSSAPLSEEICNNKTHLDWICLDRRGRNRKSIHQIFIKLGWVSPFQRQFHAQFGSFYFARAKFWIFLNIIVLACTFCGCAFIHSSMLVLHTTWNHDKESKLLISTKPGPRLNWYS